MSDAQAHPHLAQYEVVMFGFDGVDTARDTLTDVKEDGRMEDAHVLAEAVVTHAPSGKIHVHEPGAAGIGGAVGAVGGGFIAMFAGPVALPFLLVAGGLLGGVAGHMAGRILPMADLREVAEALPLGSSAYLALVDHEDARHLEEIFAPFEPRVVSAHVDSEMAGVLGHDLVDRIAHPPTG
jgi:uncharacterized membrane protein